MFEEDFTVRESLPQSPKTQFFSADLMCTDHSRPLSHHGSLVISSGNFLSLSLFSLQTNLLTIGANQETCDDNEHPYSDRNMMMLGYLLLLANCI
jgi:hypothetical protein